jgi:hypothetical protein
MKRSEMQGFHANPATLLPSEIRAMRERRTPLPKTVSTPAKIIDGGAQPVKSSPRAGQK